MTLGRLLQQSCRQQYRRYSCAGLAIVLAVALTAPASALAALRATPTVTPVALYHFQGVPDGVRPAGSLALDATGVLGVVGALYGVTEFGGILCDGGTNTCGTVFMLKPPAPGQTKWTETVLYRFKSGQDGKNPRAGLILDTKRRALYGTTHRGGGGVNCGPPTGDCGTVFRLRPPLAPAKPWRYTVLHRFADYAEGSNPGPLVLRGGQIHGFTAFGGIGGGGTVFTLTPPGPGQTDWTKTRIYEVGKYRQELEPRGQGIVGAPAFDKAGRILFATQRGGSCPSPYFDCGTVYRLSQPPVGQTEWIGEILYRFTGGSDGAWPLTGLAVNGRGVIIGTTSTGGSKGGGGVFGLAVSSVQARAAGDATAEELFAHDDEINQGVLDRIAADHDREAKEDLFFFTLRTPSGQVNLLGLIFLAGAANKYLENLELKEKQKVRFPGRSGVNPSGPVVRGADGSLYGVTSERGGHDAGTVYAVPPIFP